MQFNLILLLGGWLLLSQIQLKSKLSRHVVGSLTSHQDVNSQIANSLIYATFQDVEKIILPLNTFFATKSNPTLPNKAQSRIPHHESMFVSKKCSHVWNDFAPEFVPALCVNVVSGNDYVSINSVLNVNAKEFVPKREYLPCLTNVEPVKSELNVFAKVFVPRQGHVIGVNDPVHVVDHVLCTTVCDLVHVVDHALCTVDCGGPMEVCDPVHVVDYAVCNIDNVVASDPVLVLDHALFGCDVMDSSAEVKNSVVNNADFCELDLVANMTELTLWIQQ